MADDVNKLLRLARQKRDERLGRGSEFGEAGARFAQDALPIYGGINPLIQALQDPSLANVTNAGVRVPLSLAGIVPGAIPAAGLLGMLGLGEAARRDLNPEVIGEAQAQTKGKNKQGDVKANATLPGLTPEQNAEYNSLQDRLRKSDFGSGADRRAVEGRVKELRGLSDSFSTERNKSSQKEYDDAVKRAETARDDIMSRRPPRFNETETGKIFEKFGIAAPGVMAAGAGLLTGMASGGRMLPAAVGAVTGGLAANYPLGHEVMFAPAANQEREAMAAYARELPPDHPRREEWQQYASALPDKNPARKAAVEEFYDPWLFAERTGLGVAEGLVGGLAGGEAVNVGRKVRDAAGGSLAAAKNTLTDLLGSRANVPPNPLANTQGRYPPLGSPAREQIRSGYRTAVNEGGAPLEPHVAGRMIQDEAAKAGGSLPKLSGRIKETNAGYQDFLTNNGRPPVSKTDWDQVYRDTKTLAIPAAATAGAATLPITRALAPDQAEAAPPDEFTAELMAVAQLLQQMQAQQSTPTNMPFQNAVPAYTPEQPSALNALLRY